MNNKELFIHTMGENLDRLLSEVEMEYRKKLQQLIKKNEENVTALNNANEEIQQLTKKNEELMKEIALLRQPINEVEVVSTPTVLKKENPLTTHIFDQIYFNLENNKLERTVVLEEFHSLLNWNLKMKYYKDEKIIKLWSLLLHQHRFRYSEWEEVFRDRNIHALLFKQSEAGLRKLIASYIKLNDIDALKNIFDYILTQIIKTGRFESIHSYVLLNILFYDMTKRYFYQKDLRSYYLNTKNNKVKRIYETYLVYLKSPTKENYLEALGPIEKFDNLIIQIGGSKAMYLDAVFKEVRNEEIAKQKKFFQLNQSQEPTQLIKSEEPTQVIISEETGDTNTEGQPFEMNDKSALMAYGYQISDRTPEQRWRALQKAVPELGLKKVVYTIDNHIKLRAHNKAKFSYSLRQWSMDLEKLKKTYYRNDFIWPRKRY